MSDKPTERPAIRTHGKFYKLPQELAARREIAPSAKIVYAVLLDHSGGNGKCWPGVRKLAVECGLDAKTVVEAIARLERIALIDVDRRGNGRGNVYRMTESAGENGAPEKTERSENPPGGAGDSPLQAMELLPQNQTQEPDPLKQTHKRAKRKAAALPEIPEKLRAVEGFEAKWAEWLAYRRQDIRKPVTPRMAAGQFRLLLEQADPVAVLEASIRSGWSGLFPSKDNGRGDKAKTKQTGGTTDESGKYVFWKGGGVRAAGEGRA